MNNKIKEVFDQVQAEETLKNSTKEFLANKTQGYTESIKQPFHIYAVVCVCLLFLLIGGRWLYFTPTSIISIDINPSFELNVNRFDRIISVNSFNADGQDFTNNLHVRFMRYTDAVDQILKNQHLTDLLSNDEVVAITVAGSDETQSAKIFSEIEGCTAEHRNTYCYFSSSAEIIAAHETGLSCGKYRAYLELQRLDPDITPERIQNMTMREIWDLIDSLAQDNGIEISPENQRKYGHHGDGDGHGCGQKNRCRQRSH
ncbi:MAG: hypothetical protein HFH53_02315 [Hespellia sp.]|jgi:hypothetical protein|nr:hypothetical protein [Hespellia sp.]